MHAHRPHAAARHEHLARQHDRLLHVEPGIVEAQLRQRCGLDLAVLPHQHGAAAPQIVAVDPDVVWAKLAALAEGARIASREFWK